MAKAFETGATAGAPFAVAAAGQARWRWPAAPMAGWVPTVMVHDRFAARFAFCVEPE